MNQSLTFLQQIITIMPEGRQSPSPDTQRSDQNAPTGDRPDQGRSDKQAEDLQQKNKETLANLESNPRHILADAAEEKTSKTVK
jgi:hypothetical protein